jgi:hypothetical protein
VGEIDMDANDRPRKKIAEGGKADRRRKSPVSRGAPAGSLKGKPVAGEDRIGREKPGLAAARRSASDTERTPGRRGDLPMPMERPDPNDRHEGRSLRLTLRVEGESITVVRAMEVDAPPSALQPVRGSTFLEVRAGDRVLALERLVDPGVAVGIPDRRDTKEFRGHREIELPSYEVAIRVPLEAMESTSEGPGDGPPIEVAIYRATETMEVDPLRFDATRETAGRLDRVAATGRLTVDEVRGAERSEYRKPQPRQGS